MLSPENITSPGSEGRLKLMTLVSPRNAMEGLESAKGYLRTHLAKSLSLRVAPEIHFILDRGLEHAQRMNEILDDLKPEEDS